MNNRYVANFPSDPHLAWDEANGRALLFLSETRILEVGESEHKRLSSLIANTDKGHAVYTIAVLLRPYVERYIYLTGSEHWPEIRQQKESLNRLETALSGLQSVTLDYSEGRLCQVSVSAIVDKSGKKRSYIVPDIVAERMELWRTAGQQGACPLEGIFQSLSGRARHTATL